MALIQIHGTNGGRDERGLVSVVVPHLAESFEAIFGTVPEPMAGLKEVARTWTHDGGGAFRVEITFEGSVGGGGVSSEDATTYSCQSGFREEPIEAHPQIQKLIKDFNGTLDLQTGKVTFEPTLTGTGTNALAGDGGQADAPKNPMAGVEKYMALEVVWEKKYISNTKPRMASVGRVISSPPGEPPTVPNRSAWLVMPPTFTKRGNVYEVTETWQLLPEGTPKEVYNLGGGSGGAAGLENSYQGLGSASSASL
jgi:hypothetical protein